MKVILSPPSLSLSCFPFVLFFISLPSLKLNSEQSIQLCSPALQTNLWPRAELLDHLALSQPHLALSLNDSEVIRCTLLVSIQFCLKWITNLIVVVCMYCRGISDTWKISSEEWTEWPEIPPVWHLYRGLYLVYSQHWLLFTGSQRHKTSYKWLLQFMPSVNAINHIQRPLCDTYTQIVIVQNTFFWVVTAKSFNVFFWDMHFNPAAGNEMKITWLKRSVALTSKHFCHQHCGIHIKRSTFRYLFTSFGLKVRVFPSLGKAWVERGRRLMI